MSDEKRFIRDDVVAEIKNKGGIHALQAGRTSLYQAEQTWPP